MSDYEVRPGDFSLFPASAEDKERVSDDLVMSGSGVSVEGEECWASVFRATKKDGTPVKTKDGKQVYNLRLKSKNAAAGASTKKIETHPSDDIDDDIPFN
jgi:hypothetical protein